MNLEGLEDYLNRIFTKKKETMSIQERVKIENELARISYVAGYMDISIARTVGGKIRVTKIN